MSKKRITFIVIPANDDHIREFRVSPWVLWGLFLVGLGFASALGYYANGYHHKADQQLALDIERQKNADLWGVLNRTGKQVGHLEQAMSQLVEHDELLRHLHGMEQVSEDVRQMGMGGSEDLPEEMTTLELSSLPRRKRAHIEELRILIDRLQAEASLQERSFSQITDKFHESVDSLKHIPSIKPVPENEAWASSDFDYRTDPFTGKKAFHFGIDFAGRKGTPIYATADGIVTHRIVNDRRLGNAVVIEHDIFGTDDNGEPYTKEGIYRTEYGHMDKIIVKKGDRIRRGQPIGTMGNTGRSTGPHLHYAVRYQDRKRGGQRGYLDPNDFLLDSHRSETRGWLAVEE
jgi:murein DD-endopeptidase MepM/ murein hydrolase activator NlpD